MNSSSFLTIDVCQTAWTASPVSSEQSKKEKRHKRPQVLRSVISNQNLNFFSEDSGMLVFSSVSFLLLF